MLRHTDTTEEILPAVVCCDCAVWHANGDATALDTDSADYRAVTGAYGVPVGYRVVIDGYEWCFMDVDACDACERTGLFDLRTAWFVAD